MSLLDTDACKTPDTYSMRNRLVLQSVKAILT